MLAVAKLTGHFPLTHRSPIHSFKASCQDGELPRSTYSRSGFQCVRFSVWLRSLLPNFPVVLFSGT